MSTVLCTEEEWGGGARGGSWGRRWLECSSGRQGLPVCGTGRLRPPWPAAPTRPPMPTSPEGMKLWALWLAVLPAIFIEHRSPKTLSSKFLFLKCKSLSSGLLLHQGPKSCRLPGLGREDGTALSALQRFGPGSSFLCAGAPKYSRCRSTAPTWQLTELPGLALSEPQSGVGPKAE